MIITHAQNWLFAHCLWTVAKVGLVNMVIYWIWLWTIDIFLRLRPRRHPIQRRAKQAVQASARIRRGRKPPWVCQEVLRLKVLLGTAGIRQVATTFNRIHGPEVTIGKSKVAKILQDNAYGLLQLRREMRRQLPRASPVNACWALDLSFYTDQNGQTHTFIGILDHGSRLLTRLQRVIQRRSWTILGHLCLAIGEHGKPSAIRTDNERIFQSLVFKAFLQLAGIRLQRIPPASPWCNGRIERLFGTLKPLLRQLAIADGGVLDLALSEFRLFYNHIRPHQNLSGRTPAEAWNGIDPQAHPPPQKANLVSALGGLLVGFRIER